MFWHASAMEEHPYCIAARVLLKIFTNRDGKGTTSRTLTALFHHASSQTENLKALFHLALRDMFVCVCVCVSGYSGDRFTCLSDAAPHSFVAFRCLCGAEGRPVGGSIGLKERRVMASRWWKASVRKSVAVDKHFILSRTRTHSSSSETEDECSFSTPLLRLHIPFTTFIFPQGGIHLASQISSPSGSHAMAG